MGKIPLSKHYFEIISEHFIIVTVVIAALFPILGFVYEYTLLRHFYISIIMFSNSTDFLLSAFKKPWIPYIYFLALIGLILIGCLQKALAMKKTLCFTMLFNFFIPLLILISLKLYIERQADKHADDIKQQHPFYVKLKLKDESLISKNSKDIIMISASGQYVFLYKKINNENGKTIIIPREQIVSLTQSPFEL
ncbi:MULTISPECIES: hypothetical protein [unclassified Pseudoalteromonas]|uniref:hypothetical protein n=1 Tax=unclassified Pseudoalteromonas TaxID=194690 RepID=UPI00390C52F4